MGGRKSYSLKKAIGTSREAKRIQKTLKEAIKKEDPKKIASESIRLAVNTDKQIKDFTKGLSEILQHIDQSKKEKKIAKIETLSKKEKDLLKKIRKLRGSKE